MKRAANNVEILECESMCVGKDKVIRLRYRIFDKKINKLIQYGDDLIYLHGGYGGAFPKVEDALKDMRIGDRVELDLFPEEGYGHHDSSLILNTSLDGFGGATPQLGEMVEGELPDGSSVDFYVIELKHDEVVLDGNHPFAGKSLFFEFDVLDIRLSTSVERSVGYVLDVF